MRRSEVQTQDTRSPIVNATLRSIRWMPMSARAPSRPPPVRARTASRRTTPAQHRDAGVPVPAVRAGSRNRHPRRPHLARQGHRPGAGVVRRRPARQQPGPDRPDEPGPQAADVRTAGQDGLQGDRGRFPVGQPDRLRLRPRIIEQGAVPGRHHPGADPVPSRTDRAHLPGLRRRTQRDRALGNSTSILQRRVVFRADRDEIRRSPPTAPASAWRRRPKHPARWRYEYSRSPTGTELEYAKGLRCGLRGHRTDPDWPLIVNLPPPSRWRPPTSTPTRSVDEPAPGPSGLDHPEPAPAQRPRNRSRRSQWAIRPARTGSRAACSATASAPETSAW